MDVLFRLGEGTVADVLEEMPEDVTYSAVRSVLRVLEEKGHVDHRQEGPRYVYAPTLSEETVRREALRHLISTFFDGSSEAAAVALLRMSDLEMDDDLVSELDARIREAEREGR
jgi:predicted transcriptional regulator